MIFLFNKNYKSLLSSLQMHEHSFIEAILSNIENREKVSKITIEVGELVGIDANHLGEHIIEKTGWDVNVSEKKSKVKCECGYNGEAKILQRLHDMVIFECPNCGNAPEILQGKDIKIINVTYK